MNDQLEVLLADGVIDEVLGRLKSGKEANISLVRRGDQVIAAKVYKDRATRSFKNNADYKEGRKVRNSRTQRAMESGGRFGRDAAEQAWKSAEADALYKLVDSGVRVPTPLMFYEGVLLMDLVRDAEGRPAPRLIDISIEPHAAIGIYADLCAQIIAMLCCDVIHGDLSPYNILAAADGPTIIDFPQVISAVHSSRAEFFFLRDFDNVVRFIAGFDPALAVHTADGRAIWRAYVSRELTPQYVPPPPPPPRSTRGPDRRGPRPDQRGPRMDPRGPRMDQRGPRPDQRGPRPDGRGPGADPRGPRLDGRGPGPDPRGPRPDPRGARPDQRGTGGPSSRPPDRRPDYQASPPPPPRPEYQADPPRPPPVPSLITAPPPRTEPVAQPRNDARGNAPRGGDPRGGDPRGNDPRGGGRTRDGRNAGRGPDPRDRRPPERVANHGAGRPADLRPAWQPQPGSAPAIDTSAPRVDDRRPYDRAPQRTDDRRPPPQVRRDPPAPSRSPDTRPSGEANRSSSGGSRPSGGSPSAARGRRRPKRRS